MTQQVSRLNLTGYNFPMLSSGIGKSILAPSPLDAGDKVYGQAKFRANPELIYCENLLPTTEGYKSCIFTEVVTLSTNPPSTSFSEVYNVASADGAIGLFAPVTGNNQLWHGTTWRGTGAFGDGIATTHANIGGQSYVCWEFTGIRRIDVTDGNATPVVEVGTSPEVDSSHIAGISLAAIKGIVASGNYLIAFSDTLISWSNPASNLDFVPSLTTGAGSAIPAELRGKIVTCSQVVGGFIIYTTQNAVMATATNNATFPWVFSHIAGSTGLRSSGDAVSDDIDEVSTAWTVDGLQSIQATGVSPVLPEITDFLSARQLETYTVSTGELVTTDLSAELKVMLHKISKRYFVISYGVTEFTHALIFDAALQRWGKIVFTHVEVIAMPTVNAASRKELCFVRANGSIVRADSDTLNDTANSVAIFGRITTTRTSKVTLQSVEIETVATTNNLTVKVGTSYDGGVAQDTPVALTAQTSGTNRKYFCRKTGAAHYLHITGRLNLSCLTVTTTQDGVR